MKPNNYKQFFLVLISITSLSLTACASLNSDFECKMKPGVTCKSLDEINTMIDTGQLTETTHKEFLLSPNKTKLSLAANQEQLNIWVAPYEDNNGNFHYPTVIRTPTE